MWAARWPGPPKHVCGAGLVRIRRQRSGWERMTPGVASLLAFVRPGQGPRKGRDCSAAHVCLRGHDAPGTPPRSASLDRPGPARPARWIDDDRVYHTGGRRPGRIGFLPKKISRRDWPRQRRRERGSAREARGIQTAVGLTLVTCGCSSGRGEGATPPAGTGFDPGSGWGWIGSSHAPKWWLVPSAPARKSGAGMQVDRSMAGRQRLLA